MKSMPPKPCPLIEQQPNKLAKSMLYGLSRTVLLQQRNHPTHFENQASNQPQKLVFYPCCMDCTVLYSTVSNNNKIPNTSHTKKLLGKCAQALLKIVPTPTANKFFLTLSKSLKEFIAHYLRLTLIT